VSTPELREQNRRNFIATAIEVLNRSLDYQETLASLPWIAVPTIADWCVVDILEGGTLQRLAVAHVDPSKLELASEIQRRFPPDLGATTGTAGILRSGKPEWFAELTPEMMEQSGADPEYVALIQRLGLRSYIGVPLRRGTDTIGVISLIMAESGRAYDEGDLALALTLADRASAAIQNATLFKELEHAHQHTAAERDRLVQLVDAAPVAIAILRGADLIFDVVNKPFERTFGGRKLRGVRQAELDPTGENAKDLHRVIQTGRSMQNHERAVHFDWEGSGVATTRYFDLTMAPMRNGDGGIDGVMSFTIDVTEQVLARKRMEEARTQAEHANRAKDEFLAMLGHELRNPLAPILTALELMELRDPAAFQRERTVISRQVRHVVRLVDDLLDVSRITRGSVELHREELDLADIVGKAIEIASPLLEERGHQLVTRIPRGVIVSGDPIRLAQVAANLLTNAAKYTERGGTITVTVARESARAVIRVRDTGIGIAPDVLPYVFDTFYQGRQAIDRAQGGLGLGLAIVRSLITLHGGTVAVTSEGPGKGSEFSVWIPALEASSRPRAAIGTVPRGTIPLRSERILVVDDNADALTMLADALEQRGFATFRAHDAPSALALAAQVHPQIALLDIGLPVMDGYELGRRLRETVGLEALQLVAVTGYGQASDLEKSHAAGFAAHLVKPISLATVHSTIERLTLASTHSKIEQP
jgi:signal transduction histidine kinase/ActR/RegA family two-component response regulator